MPKESIKIDPGYADAYYNRGLAWYFKKRYDKAIADYREAIRLNPGDADAYFYRDHAWRDKKEDDKAHADCNEVLGKGQPLILALKRLELAAALPGRRGFPRHRRCCPIEASRQTDAEFRS